MPDGESMGAFIRLSAFGNVLVTTHLVVEPMGENGHIILRMSTTFGGDELPEPNSPRPDMYADSLAQALAKCDADDVWISLCEPSQPEDARVRFRDSHRETLTS